MEPFSHNTFKPNCTLEELKNRFENGYIPKRRKKIEKLKKNISRNAREGVPYGLPRAADDDRQKEDIMEKKEGCFFWLFRPECYSRLDNMKKQIVSLKYDLEIERQARRFAEDDAVKLHEMNEELKEENEALKKEKSFAWDRAENLYDENIDADVLMARYDEFLQKLNELNEKMKEELKL